MIRFAILGCDSSHTEAFTDSMNGTGARFADRCRIAAIWGEDRAQAESKAKALGIPVVAGSVEAALAQVDAALVLGRFPESHFTPASIALAKGIPTFIDKPLVADPVDGAELLAIARRSDARLMSASIYRFAPAVATMKGRRFASAIVTGPRECNDLGPDPRFQDLFFYGIHSVEAALEMFGFDVEQVSSSRTERGTIAVLTFRSGFLCAMNFLSALPGEYYHVAAFGEVGPAAFDLKLEMSLYDQCIERIHDLFEGGKATVAPESNLMAVRVIDAIKRGGTRTL